MNHFPIQRYTKFALSLAYFPDSGGDAAIHRLWRWIRRDPSLVAALRDAGYKPTQHHYTARQTQLIFEHLGEP